jgi:hypothetical protein
MQHSASVTSAVAFANRRAAEENAALARAQGAQAVLEVADLRAAYLRCSWEMQMELRRLLLSAMQLPPAQVALIATTAEALAAAAGSPVLALGLPAAVDYLATGGASVIGAA